jgi:phosphate transport system substrate-binding protein
VFRKLSVVTLFASFFFVAHLSLCAGSGGVLRVQGSGPFLSLTRRWAEEYMKKHRGAVVQVVLVSSGAAISALLDGSADIIQASRPVKDSEKERILKRRGQPVKETPIAMDGIGIFVNQDNPVTEITLAQLKLIYSGRVASWISLGSTLGPITVYGLDSSSDLYAFFRESVLDREGFGAGILSFSGVPAVVDAVARDSRAIGYGGINPKGVKVLPLKKDDPSDAVEPTPENIAHGKYPLSRRIFFDTVGAPEGLTQSFMNWVLGPQGKKICLKSGYFTP